MTCDEGYFALIQKEKQTSVLILEKGRKINKQKKKKMTQVIAP